MERMGKYEQDELKSVPNFIVGRHNIDQISRHEKDVSVKKKKGAMEMK
jgi:hypothetical protein